MLRPAKILNRQFRKPTRIPYNRVTDDEPMSTRAGERSPCGSIALVSYIPEPLGSFFYKLRGTLPGESHPQAHITILPPRPLRVSVNAASEQVLAVLSKFAPFEVELANVGRFAETGFLFVNVGEGADTFHALHDALNRGDLAYEEEFEFRPHLTLGGPVPNADTAAVQDQAEAAWLAADHARRFLLDDIALLCSDTDDPNGEWYRLWTYSLNTKATALTKAAAAALTNRTS